MGVGAAVAGLGRLLGSPLGRALAVAGGLLLVLYLVRSNGIDVGIGLCQAERLATQNAALRDQLDATAAIAAGDRAAREAAEAATLLNEERIDALEAELAGACLLDEPGAEFLRDLRP